MTHPDSLARRQRFLWRSLILALLGLSSLVAAWAWAVGNDFLVVERWPEYRAAVLGLISSYPVLSTVTLFLVHLLLAALALPGASVLMLVVGAGYGTWFGTWLCLTACTAGATLCMLAVRHYLRPTVRRRMGERLAFLDERIARDGKSYLFGLRVLPVVPFAIVNVAAGMSQMKAWSFIWVSYLGMWFGTFVYVNAGSELARIDSIDDFYSRGVVVSLAGLALLPWLLKWMERLVKSWYRRTE